MITPRLKISDFSADKSGMKRLAVFNSKGGVGKTTTTLNLAAAAAHEGQTSLLIDLDPQAHLTRTWGEVPRDSVHSLFGYFQETRSMRSLIQEWSPLGEIIPAHGQLIKVDTLLGKGPGALNKLRVGLDGMATTDPAAKHHAAALIDCCPYMGVLSLNALFATDALLIPISTDYLSLDAAQQITQAMNALEPVLKRRLPRRYVLTRFDRRRRMSTDVRERLVDRYGDEVCQTVISENVAVAESPARKRDVFAHQSTSAGAVDYLALYRELAAAGFL